MGILKRGDFVLIRKNYNGGNYAMVTGITAGGGVTLEYRHDFKLTTHVVDIKDSPNIYERLSDDVNGWLRRTHRKGPFKLYSVKPKKDSEGLDYTVIFKDKGRVKIGVISDNQSTRYGISTFGALSFPEATGLWQSGPGAVSEDQLIHMIEFYCDESELADWSVTQLKNIKY